MHRTLALSLALMAGFLGGTLSEYITLPPVLAQPGTSRNIKAQSFVVVDDKNNIVGTFQASADRIASAPTVILLDRNGKEIWRAGVSAKVLTER
jgi:predicted ABC-type sugar transport system permease subunit